MVCIDTAKIAEIVEDGMLDTFINDLASQSLINLLIAREASEKYEVYAKEIYVDCIDFTEKIGASTLASSLKEAVIGIDAREARIGIYFPSVISYYDQNYGKAHRFSRNTLWDAFLFRYVHMIDQSETSQPKEQHEPLDNVFHTAYVVHNGGSYQSYLSAPLDIDIYSFTITRSGVVTVSLSHIPAYKNYSFSLSSKDTPEIEINLDGTTQPAGESESMGIDLESGTYYIKVYGDGLDDYSYDDGDSYRITFSGTAEY
jgi:hypothetical protein